LVIVKKYMKRYICIFSILALFLSINIACNKNQEKVKDDTKDLNGWYIGGGKEDGYEIGAATDKYNGGPVYYLRSNNITKEKFGTIIKNFNPSEYYGKRIKLSGYIKSDKVYGWAGIWLRIDGGAGDGPYGKTLAFDNMQNRPIKETTEWKKYEIVTDVPKESKMLFYGALLHGSGEIGISDLKFEVVGNETAITTWIPQPDYPQ